MGSRFWEEKNMTVKMKVFVPMSDATVGENGEVDMALVPFDPAFLAQSRVVHEGNKPTNWVANYDGQQARARLSAASA